MIGLKQQYQNHGRRYPRHGFHAIAIDLFNGSVVTNRDEAKTHAYHIR
jgi:dienelactone hydrolase